MPSLGSPVKSQVKPPIVSLPFFMVDDKSEVDTLCGKLADAYDEFSTNFHSIIADSIHQGVVSNRYQIERVFSEWAFSRITGKASY